MKKMIRKLLQSKVFVSGIGTIVAESIQAQLKDIVTEVLNANDIGTKSDESIPTLGTKREAKLESYEDQIIQKMVDNPTGGLVATKVGRGRTRVTDMLVKRLYTIQQVKEDRAPWNATI